MPLTTFAVYGVVAPEETETFMGRPNVAFKAKYLIILPKNCDFFEVLSVTVGNRVQISNPLPATMFLSPAWPSAKPIEELNKLLDMEFDVCRPPEEIRIKVLNTSAVRREFSALFFGEIG